MKKSYVVERNYQSKVRAFCIALLNRNADMIIKIRKKSDYVALPFLRIQNIRFTDDDVIDLASLIKRRISLLENLDHQRKITSRTAAFRRKKNSTKESINIVVDILGELGYSIKTKETRGRNFSLKFDTVISIHRGNEFYSQEQIETIGAKILEGFLKKYENTKTVVLKRNDSSLIPFFNS